MLRKLLYLTFSLTVLVSCHKDFTEHINNISFDMVYVKGGKFPIEVTTEWWEENANRYNKSTHLENLSDYYIGKFEVTQGLWKAVMGENPSCFQKGDNYPVENVSWKDAQEFCTKLSQLTGKKYALPTEAQWEYAARGGVKSQGYKYSGCNNFDEVAWCAKNSEKTTHPVGLKKANELGIYDMSGNVWEWCQGWYDNIDSLQYREPNRKLCGGSWLENSYTLTQRYSLWVKCRYNWNGFRVVLLP